MLQASTGQMIKQSSSDHNFQSALNSKNEPVSHFNNMLVKSVSSINQLDNDRVGFIKSLTSNVGGVKDLADKIYTKVMSPIQMRKINKDIKFEKGILIYGPPGTGKTKLAKTILKSVIVKEDKMHLVSASSILNQCPATSVANLRSVFKPAIDDFKKESKDIHGIFFDEIDVMLKRGRWGDQTDSQRAIEGELQTLMSGPEGYDNFLVIGSTNKTPTFFGDALMRNGRFSISARMGMPEFKERIEIIELIFSRLTTSSGYKFDSISVEWLAQKTLGKTGADIEYLINSAVAFAENESLLADANKKIALDKLLEGIHKKSISTEDAAESSKSHGVIASSTIVENATSNNSKATLDEVGAVTDNSGNTVESRKRPLSDSSDTSLAPRKHQKKGASTISENSTDEVRDESIRGKAVNYLADNSINIKDMIISTVGLYGIPHKTISQYHLEMVLVDSFDLNEKVKLGLEKLPVKYEYTEVPKIRDVVLNPVLEIVNNVSSGVGKCGVIIVRGMEGSGKTAICRKIIESQKGFDNITLLSPYALSSSDKKFSSVLKEEFSSLLKYSSSLIVIDDLDIISCEKSLLDADPLEEVTKNIKTFVDNSGERNFVLVITCNEEKKGLMEAFRIPHIRLDVEIPAHVDGTDLSDILKSKGFEDSCINKIVNMYQSSGSKMTLKKILSALDFWRKIDSSNLKAEFDYDGIQREFSQSSLLSEKVASLYS